MNNNSEDSNTERPLPPLPSNDGSLDPLDESPDDSSDIDENDSDECSSDEADDDQITNEPSTKLLNGTSSNGSNEYDDNFDPDATLPPSPSKTTNTSLTEFTSANSSSHEMPSSPENERFNILLILSTNPSEIQCYSRISIQPMTLVLSLSISIAITVTQQWTFTKCRSETTKATKAPDRYGSENQGYQAKTEGIGGGCRGSAQKTQVSHDFLWCCCLRDMLCIRLLETWLKTNLIIKSIRKSFVSFLLRPAALPPHPIEFPKPFTIHALFEVIHLAVPYTYTIFIVTISLTFRTFDAVVESTFSGRAYNESPLICMQVPFLRVLFLSPSRRRESVIGVFLS